MKKTLFILLVFLVLGGCIAAPEKRSVKDHEHKDKFTKHYKSSMFKVTGRGLFSVELVLKSGELKKGANEVNLIVHDSKDRDVVDADITIQPWMPETGHGIDIEPVIEEKGGGLYHVSNLVLTMGGHWELRVGVSKAGVSDMAVFDFPRVGGIKVKHRHVKRPGKIDTSTTQVSENGAYKVSYIPEITPVRINTIHSWTVKITDRKGNPVTGARISVEADMPEHGHGLPTAPEVVEELPGGEYIIDGMKFQMPGWWVVKLHVSSAEVMDTVTFQLDISR